MISSFTLAEEGEGREEDIWGWLKQNSPKANFPCRCVLIRPSKTEDPVQSRHQPQRGGLERILKIGNPNRCRQWNGGGEFLPAAAGTKPYLIRLLQYGHALLPNGIFFFSDCKWLDVAVPAVKDQSGCAALRRTYRAPHTLLQVCA